MPNVNINNIKNYLFYKLPKCILENEPYKTKLSSTSKIAYMLVLNRLSLSISNRWVDSKGDVFIYYSRQELQNDIPTSKKTAISVFKQLEELNLIHQCEQGKGLAYKIYVEDVFTQVYEKKKVVENLPNTSVKTTPPLVEKLHPNKNKENKNENHNSSSIELDKIKDKCLLKDFSKTILKTGVSIGSLLNATIDTLYYLPVLTIDNKDYNNTEIRTMLGGINEQHLQKVESIFLTNYENVRNYKSYLITCVANVLLGKDIPRNMITFSKKYVSNYKGREYTEEFMESLYDNLDSHEEESQELEL
ncbi:MAG: replication initiator protein A [Clostridia bacterium]|nr:replication initiator protein A [Clostridia bacterium]